MTPVTINNRGTRRVWAGLGLLGLAGVVSILVPARGVLNADR